MNKMNESVIHLDDVTRVFYAEEMETHALSNVTLDIELGEYIYSEGPSG